MDKTVVQQHKQNFETLRKAFHDGQVCLMDCTLKATGEHVAVICAVAPVGDEMEFVPFAMFFNGNPYELLNPPSA
jgi:hypothetical protein